MAHQTKKVAVLQSSATPEKKAISKGGRNDYLTSRAGALRRAGLEQEEIESVLLRENETIVFRLSNKKKCW